MKLRIFCILFISLLFFSAFSCTNYSSKSRKPIIKITLSPHKKNIFTGDSVSISVSVKLKNGEPDKAELFLDNELVKTTNETAFNFPVNRLNNPGKHQIKVVATKKDGTEGINFYSFEVLSDIQPEMLSYEIIKTYPHNTDHFTQGLEIHNDEFYESTGENGKSFIYRFDLNTGKVLQSVKLNDKYFGEGISIMNDKIYQLTYKAQKGFIYNLNTFAKVDSFSYETQEGWGLTHNNRYLIKTDGSEFLHFIDPSTMQVVKKIPVYDHKGPVKNLNELEYADGYIYANIWTTSYAVKIDPETGKVLSKIDFSGLLSVMYHPEKPVDVLNGIAINQENGKIYITGKLWPKLFEVKLVKKGQDLH